MTTDQLMTRIEYAERINPEGYLFTVSEHRWSLHAKHTPGERERFGRGTTIVRDWKRRPTEAAVEREVAAHRKLRTNPDWTRR